MEELGRSGRRHLILQWRRFRVAVFYVHLVVEVTVSDGWDLPTSVPVEIPWHSRRGGVVTRQVKEAQILGRNEGEATASSGHCRGLVHVALARWTATS